MNIFPVSFVTTQGDVLLSGNDKYKDLENIYTLKELRKHKNTLLTKNSTKDKICLY